MNEKVNQLLSEGGKVYSSNNDECIVEKNGQYFRIDKSGTVSVTNILLD